MLDVIMLSVVMLSIVTLSVIVPSVIMLSVIVPSVIMLSVNMLRAIMLSAVMLNVIVLSVEAPWIWIWIWIQSSFYCRFSNGTLAFYTIFFVIKVIVKKQKNATFVRLCDYHSNIPLFLYIFLMLL